MLRIGGEIEEGVAIAQEPGIAHGRRVESFEEPDLRRAGRATRTLQDGVDPSGGNHRATHAGTNVVPAVGQCALELRVGLRGALLRRELPPARLAEPGTEPA